MRQAIRRRLALLAALAVPALALQAVVPAAPAVAHGAGAHPAAGLPLGRPGLAESRTTETLAPGVTLTTISRGAVDPADAWTLQVYVPTTGPVTDPPAFGPRSTLVSRESAEAAAAILTAKGYEARVERFDNPDFADLPAGTLGFGVRIGRYADRAAAGAAAGALAGLGWPAAVYHTTDDGLATTGPWWVRVLSIDPHRFHGTIAGSHGDSLVGRVTTSQVAAQTGAVAAVNGGFFVISPFDGIPGDPAGIHVEHGKLLSEATNGRVALQLLDGGRRIRIGTLTSTTTLTDAAGERHRIDGVNRTPGVIRDCGGDADDVPTALPAHDTTCTDPDELVVFTSEFTAPTPAGPGAEALLDATGTVTAVGARTGETVPPGGQLVQAIGTEATWLTGHVHAGDRLAIRSVVRDEHGRRLRLDEDDSIVNGGPQLVDSGDVSIAPVADGLVHAADPTFFWTWGVRRHSRTMAGVTWDGHILLVTADGQRPGYSVGLSLPEGGRLMRALGARSAMNLDGGGSTTMVVHGQVVGLPSDPTGERADGGSVVILP